MRCALPLREGVSFARTHPVTLLVVRQSDVDCGGEYCMECRVGKACAQGSDCTSGVCTANVCAEATCSDSLR